MSGYECRNKWVFSLRRNTDNDGADVTSSGRLFQTTGPAETNGRSPTSLKKNQWNVATLFGKNCWRLVEQSIWMISLVKLYAMSPMSRIFKLAILAINRAYDISGIVRVYLAVRTSARLSLSLSRVIRQTRLQATVRDAPHRWQMTRLICITIDDWWYWDAWVCLVVNFKPICVSWAPVAAFKYLANLWSLQASDISAKLLSVCPARCSVNQWILCTSLVGNEFDLISFHMHIIQYNTTISVHFEDLETPLMTSKMCIVSRTWFVLPCPSLPQQNSQNVCILCVPKNYRTPFGAPVCWRLRAYASLCPLPIATDALL